MKIPEDFKFESFNAVWWAPDVHTQTVIASFSKINNPDPKRIEIPTPDDDFLELDVVDLDNRNLVVVLFHGLEGSSERHYIRNLMFDLRSKGFSSVGVNFRGCGYKINRQRRLYHSGETEDYKTVFEWVNDYFQQPQIFAVGFSLGGNALVKSLGELGQDHPVSKAVAVSPPYDLKKGSINMDKGFNKVYQKRFLNTLSEKSKLKQNQFPEYPVFTGTSVYEFDDQVTAPVHGFTGADDYYKKCSSGQFYKYIQKPLLIIHSKTDSLCPLRYAPLDDLNSNNHIHTLFTEAGGHVGFISSPRGWLNRTIIDWLKA